MNTIVLLFLTLVFSIIFSLIIVPKVIKIALNRKFIDSPGGRKSHKEPIPLLGGIAIWLSFILAIYCTSITYFIYDNVVNGSTKNVTSMFLQPNLYKFYILFLGASILLILGFIDDVIKNGVHYRNKLIIQSAVALLLIFSGIRFEIFSIDWLNNVITFCWLIGIINTINLLDGLDGLASGIIITSASALLIFAITQNQLETTIFLAALIGSSIGFFKNNFFSAKIFLGDSGSLFSGYILGAFSILIANGISSELSYSSYLIPLIIFSIPIADTFSVTIIRLLRKKSVFFADRNHLHHRLIDLEIGTKRTVILILGINIFLALSSLLLPSLNVLGCVIILMQTLIIICGIYTSVTIMEKHKRLNRIKSLKTISLSGMVYRPKEEMLN